LNFLDRFSKNSQISNFIKTYPVGAQFYAGRRADGQTDMTKLIIAFRNFSNAHKKEIIILHVIFSCRSVKKYHGKQSNKQLQIQ
jgi:hypothetical protein